MSIEITIQSLLVARKGIIVPGLGAFTLIDKKASIDEAVNKIYPPTKEVQYKSTIISDPDKVLEKELEKSDKEAEKTLQRFTEKLKQDLKETGTGSLEGFGTIQKKGSSYTFSLDSAFYRMLNPSANQGVSLPGKKPVATASSVTPRPATPTPLDKPTKPAAKPIVKPVNKTANKPANKPTAATTPETKKTPETTKKKKSYVLLLAVIVSLLCIGTLTTILFRADKKPTDLPPLTSPSGKALEVTEKSRSIEAEVEAKAEVMTTQTKDTAVDAIDDYYTQFSKFSLITGSFLSRKKAHQHQQELKGEGFLNSHIITHDSLLRVSIQTLGNREQALQELTRLRTHRGEDFVWLLSHD